jgi:hypothetical protein
LIDLSLKNQETNSSEIAQIKTVNSTVFMLYCLVFTVYRPILLWQILGLQTIQFSTANPRFIDRFL